MEFTDSQFVLVIFEEKYELSFTTSTYDDPGENSTNVSVVSVQPLSSILILESDTTSFKARLLWGGWRQRRELVWKIYNKHTD